MAPGAIATATLSKIRSDYVGDLVENVQHRRLLWVFSTPSLDVFALLSKLSSAGRK